MSVNSYYEMVVSSCCNLQGRSVVVFYGSQTGTAEDFAGRLARDASRYGMKAIVADPEESDMVWVSFTHIQRFLVMYFYGRPA